MITKHRILKTVSTVALMLCALISGTRAARAGGNPVELAFTKWFGPGGPEGRLDGTAGTFDFTGSFASPEDNPPLNPNFLIEARYFITFNGHTFTALIEGHQNNSSHRGVLNGVIESGWQEGAEVHVEYNVVDQGPCPAQTCFVGTIRIMTNSDDN